MFGFIFDLDGTIVDSTPFYRAAWAAFIDEFGASSDPDTYLQRGTRDNLRSLLGENASSHELDIHAARHADWTNTQMRARGIRAHEGVLDLIYGLHAQRIKLALATAAERSNAEWTLQALGVRQYFDAIVVDRDVPEGKPAPDVYLEALCRLGLDAAHCAVMEDSATGVRAAKAAGLRVIAVETTHSRRQLEQAGADLIVPRASQVTPNQVIQFISA